MFLITHKNLQVETAKAGTRPVSSTAISPEQDWEEACSGPSFTEVTFLFTFIFVGCAHKRWENEINWTKNKEVT